MIAIFEAWRAGLLKRRYWAQNLLSGLILGILAVPLAVSFAIASGVSPEAGIYTAIIAGLGVSLFGGSRTQIAGPTSVFASILLAISLRHGYEGVQLATILAGIFLVIFGFLRLGRAIKFVPLPVVVGFTSGIGTLLFLGQVAPFLGLREVSPAVFAQDKVWEILTHWRTLDRATCLLGLGSLLLLPVYRTLPLFRRIPAPLQILMTGMVVQFFFQFPTVATLMSSFGGMSSRLPTFVCPSFDLNLCLELVGPAFAIAMLGSIESLLTALVAEGMTNEKHSSNQELIGEGVGNMLSGLFGGIAATGAISRTSMNIRSGGNSPLAGIFSSLTLALILCFCAPLACFVPMVSLATILFLVAYNMLGVGYLRFLLLHGPRSEITILLITYCLTIFCNLVVAVNVGIIFSAFLLMARIAESTDVSFDDLRRDQDLPADLPKNLAIYRINGPFFFAMTDKFEHAMRTINSNVRVIILCFHDVPFIDLTGLRDLRHFVDQFNRKNCEVVFCEARPKVVQKLRRFGLDDTLANGRTDRTLRECVEWGRRRVEFLDSMTK